MKLLLCSKFRVSKFDKIFQDIFGENLKNMKVLLIPFANKYYDRNPDLYPNRLAGCGINKNNIYILNYKTPKENKYDIIFVACGNNCLLKKRLLESGWWDEIYKRIQNDVFYIGVSAGSVICGKGFEFSTQYEEHVEDMNDYSGYGLIDKYILVHYQTNNENYIIRNEIADKLGRENCLLLGDEEHIYYDANL